MADINSSVSGIASGIARSYNINIVDDDAVRLMSQAGAAATEVANLKNICRRSDGDLFIAYMKKETDATNNTGDIWVAKSSDDGVTWISGLALEDGVDGDLFRHANIVCTQNDTLHLLVYDDAAASDEILHFTQTTAESTWTQQSGVDIITGLEYFSAVPGDNNEIWLVADRVSTPEILIYHYNGTSWGSAESPVISGTSGTNISSQDVDLAIDQNGNLHILWVKDNAISPGENNALYYANSYDGPWNSIVIIDNGSGMDPGGAGTLKHRMTVTLNDKIHIVYPSGDFTSDDLVYTNFDIPASGAIPILTTPIVIDPSVTDHQNFVGISADVRNRIYIGALDDDVVPDVFNIYMSVNDSYNEFIKNTIDVDTGSQIPNRVYAFLSNTLPFKASARIQMPEKGVILSYVNTTPALDEYYVLLDDILSFQDLSSGIDTSITDGYLFAAEPDQFVSGFIKGNILDQFVSGYMLAAEDDQFIDGFISAFDIINSQISGFMIGADFSNSQISGFAFGHDLITSQTSGYMLAAEPDQFVSGITTGHEFVNSLINGYLLNIGDINSVINGILGQDTFTSTIFGFQGAPDFNSNIDGYILAAEDDQFIDGFIATESGINSNIDGFTKGILFDNSQISGIILGDILFNSQTSGFIIGDDLFFSDVDGFIFGVSGIPNSQINGFIRAAIVSQINGHIFGVSGIINDAVNGFSIGDLFATDNIKGVIAGYVPPLDPNEDCNII